MKLRNLFMSGVALVMLASSNAYAFITVIDVAEVTGQIVTVQNAGEYSYEQLKTRSATYRGVTSEAIKLFQAIAERELPAQLTSYEYDVNEKTGTIAVTIAISGFAGYDYQYFVLKRATPPIPMTQPQASTVEVPLALFNYKELLSTLSDLHDKSFLVTKVENYSLSSRFGVSNQVFHLVPLADAYGDCKIVTEVDETSGGNAKISLNTCPNPM